MPRGLPESNGWIPDTHVTDKWLHWNCKHCGRRTRCHPEVREPCECQVKTVKAAVEKMKLPAA